MTNSIEVKGRTEDEAIENALEQLGLSRDDVSVEILEQAKTGFLGLKSTPAKIKVTYEVKEETSQKIENFLTGLFARMDIDAGINILEKEGVVEVNLTASDAGVLIGRRGETLDAMQHLTNYVVNRGSIDRLRINFDTENYRKRRSESLENLAVRTAGKVTKYRRNMTLDPMNAYDRHIIHSALQDNGQVSTFSIGSEPNRRVVVAFGQRNSGKPGGRTERSSDNRSERRTNSGFSGNRNSEQKKLSPPPPPEPRPQNEPKTSTYREWS